MGSSPFHVYWSLLYIAKSTHAVQLAYMDTRGAEELQFSVVVWLEEVVTVGLVISLQVPDIIPSAVLAKI